MRIIGGSAKRRSMKVPSAAQGVRPILIRIKKSLFDILRPRLEGCAFLDLYAGSGAVGIEALSRGAASVTFVESDPKAVRLLRRNLQICQLLDRVQIRIEKTAAFLDQKEC